MKLPKFNKEITVTVDVDSIVDKLTSTFPDDYKHKELVSHAIVGTAVNNGGLGYIYNALNGYSPEIDFVIGDMVICSSKKRREFIRTEGEKSQRIIGEIGACKVINIDFYRTTTTAPLRRKILNGSATKIAPKQLWKSQNYHYYKHLHYRHLQACFA